MIPGIQSAVVTGPAGEEIYTDTYGRVKVQFHWDRRGKNDESSSCWLRVAQAWARDDGPSCGCEKQPTHVPQPADRAGTRVRPGDTGFKGRDHYHIPNPNSTANRDEYFDRDGQPTYDGSKRSHILPDR